MSALTQRMAIVGLIHEAVTAGARREKACAVLGLSLRTLQRWWRGGVVHSDARPDALRPVPANKLSDVERRAALALCHRPEYASLPDLFADCSITCTWSSTCTAARSSAGRSTSEKVLITPVCSCAVP